MPDINFDDVYDMTMQLSPTERQRLAQSLAHSPAGLSADEILATLRAHVDEEAQ